MGDDRHRPGTSSTFDDVLVAARLYRSALDHFGVVGCPKVTGKRGVQIWVPVARGRGAGQVRRREALPDLSAKEVG